jgi:hypothetical protein
MLRSCKKSPDCYYEGFYSSKVKNSYNQLHFCSSADYLSNYVLSKNTKLS